MHHFYKSTYNNEIKYTLFRKIYFAIWNHSSGCCSARLFLIERNIVCIYIFCCHICFLKNTVILLMCLLGNVNTSCKLLFSLLQITTEFFVLLYMHTNAGSTNFSPAQ
jgi:hypothetical protein